MIPACARRTVSPISQERRKMNRFSILILLIIFCGLISCENSLDPLDEETGTYTIYGALNLREQPNYIRVRDINAPFTKAATEPIDGRVLLYNFGTDSVAVLEDRIVEYFDLYHHNFEYVESITPNTQYRVTVERSDGVSRSQTMTTPTIPTPNLEPVNQKCNLPVNFEIAPLEGSTIVIYFGYPVDALRVENIDEDTEWRWGPKYVIDPEDYEQPKTISFTFSPYRELREILRFRSPINICYEVLKTGNIFLRYEHYGRGFYEELTKDTLDVMNTHRFGAFYYDTLAVPIDTLQRCGPECLSKAQKREGDE
jgi:hypothetical protein